MFHISHTTVNRWINELCVSELELFSSLCELLNVTIYQFIGVWVTYKFTETQLEII